MGDRLDIGTWIAIAVPSAVGISSTFISESKANKANKANVGDERSPRSGQKIMFTPPKSYPTKEVPV